jgi:hypothetical protein
MRGMRVKTLKPYCWQPTRRELLGAAAAATFGLWPVTETGYGQAVSPLTSRPAQSQAPWWLGADDHARVADVRSAGVARLRIIDSTALGEMLDQGIQSLTATTRPVAAWHAALGSAERILIKFNSVGAVALDTTEPLARLMVERLAAAGYDPAKIVLVEAPAFMSDELGTAHAPAGWASRIEVGGQTEQLARYLFDADAIINVPFLKTHQIAGMSGCLKNLSHALIRHPGRYHANGCSPYVGQVVGSQEVSSRVRLNVMNALRIVVDHGPDARAEDIVSYGGLLLGFDPLAVDNVALSILAEERRRRGVAGSLDVRYLAGAARMGLGRWRPGDIERIAIEIDA